jgi:hypothetical protein
MYHCFQSGLTESESRSMYNVVSGSGFRLLLNPYLIQTPIQTKICHDKMFLKCTLKPLKKEQAPGEVFSPTKSTQNMKFLNSFLCSTILAFMYLANVDPDPLTQWNRDPDPTLESTNKSSQLQQKIFLFVVDPHARQSVSC